MTDYEKHVKYLNHIGAIFLGLCACGMIMWSEWLLPNGEHTRVYLKEV